MCPARYPEWVFDMKGVLHCRAQVLVYHIELTQKWHHLSYHVRGFAGIVAIFDAVQVGDALHVRLVLPGYVARTVNPAIVTC